MNKNDDTQMIAFKMLKCRELKVKAGPLLTAEPLYYDGMPSNLRIGYCYTVDGGLIFTEQEGNISYCSFSDEGDDIFQEIIVQGIARRMSHEKGINRPAR